MIRPGGPELIIILVIILILFGVGRISKVGKELGTGIKEFRKGLQSEDENKPGDTTTNSDQQPKS
ncbi:Sec-independent protein translocase protein TatA [Thermoflexales bacterium]|jgi:sec-independent protein translocase protein TatA|nr:Sec-independent protein translocase protein TatA [Thermoflexales bacterium]